MNGILPLARDGRSRESGVDADRQIKLAGLGLERVVDRIAAVVHDVAPEAGADADVADRIVSHERFDLLERLHRSQEIESAGSEHEAFGMLLRELRSAGTRLIDA